MNTSVKTLALGLLLLVLSRHPACAADGFTPLDPDENEVSELLAAYMKTCPPHGDELGPDWRARCVPPEVTSRIKHVRIIDGDTFEFDHEVFRIANIDAPETDRAKCEAERLLGEVAKGQLQAAMVRPQVKRIGRDKYGRTLAYVRMLEDVDVGDLMVNMNVAEPYSGGQRRNWCE